MLRLNTNMAKKELVSHYNIDSHGFAPKYTYFPNYLLLIQPVLHLGLLLGHESLLITFA